MNQETFMRRGEPRWRGYEETLERAERQHGSVRELPQLYRAICRDLALARQRQLDAHLVDRLNRLALRGHQQMYRASTRLQRALEFCASGLPRAVRAEGRFVLVAAALFYGSAALVAGAVLMDPEMVYSAVDAEQVTQLEQMYDPNSPHQLRPRGDETDTAMFGYYIANNMGVGFRTFAGGIFLGIGTLLFLLFNGVLFGAAAAHMANIGYDEPFFSFVIGHGALELQAVVLAAAAGLVIGWSLWAPGPYRRVDALKLAVRRAVPLVYGTAALLLVAACIEAYWSASRLVAPGVKYGVGAALWLGVLLYFLLPGRDPTTPARSSGRARRDPLGRPGAAALRAAPGAR